MYNHFREQKGSIIPGKNEINARSSNVNLSEKNVSNMTFGESGYTGVTLTNPFDRLAFQRHIRQLPPEGQSSRAIRGTEVNV